MDERRGVQLSDNACLRAYLRVVAADVREQLVNEAADQSPRRVDTSNQLWNHLSRGEAETRFRMTAGWRGKEKALDETKREKKLKMDCSEMCLRVCVM